MPKRQWYTWTVKTGQQYARVQARINGPFGLVERYTVGQERVP